MNSLKLSRVDGWRWVVGKSDFNIKPSRQSRLGLGLGFVNSGQITICNAYIPS